MTHLLVFLSAALYESLFILWNRASADGHAWRAAGWSMLIGALSLYGVTSVVRDHGLGLALVAGYGVGSWVTVRWLA